MAQRARAGEVSVGKQAARRGGTGRRARLGAADGARSEDRPRRRVRAEGRVEQAQVPGREGTRFG